MKNDVVRWSSTPTNARRAEYESTIENGAAGGITNAALKSSGRLLSRQQIQFHTQQQQQQQQYCDTNNASFLNATPTAATTKRTNSFLVNSRYHSISKSKNNNNNAIKPKTAFVSIANNTPLLSRHLQLQQQVKPPRTFTPFAAFALHLNRILLNCLQLNVILVFLLLLCTLNVGFVTVPYANAAIVASNASLSAVAAAVNAIDDGVVYQLDYEEAGDNSGGDGDSARHFTHTWAVHIPSGGSGVADQVAKDHGFVNMGKVCLFYEVTYSTYSHARK
ncbi:furin-like protease 1 isoform X1 [Ceratitis capitata]|uniref:furin-like protease 1 isoform X1 n=1 Tax=Ceratitis capitata TaxID=7213 RepID=UPI000A122AF9|nr:furin-like protease 1 isoform X1 [Ceratitis capitata]XP_023159333.1 furin-like protease 1 isoform X1 [Ceratitis capitata]